MVGGFNTNVRYRGRTFHVQTEDSGPNVAKIVTLLYEGGTILFSQKTSYADEPDAGDREAVRARMEQQHCSMVEALKAGEYDREVGLAAAGSARPASPPTGESPAVAPAADAGRKAADPPPARVVSVEPRKHRALPPRPMPARAADPAGSKPPAREEPPARDFGHGVITQKPLDELVLAQLSVK